MEKKKLIWCVHHNPVELLIRVAKDFANILTKYTDEYEIEVLTSQEYADYYNNGVILDTIDMVDKGMIQISQTFAWDLAYLNQSFHVLDMPYLFRDHAHARRVIDGKIGRSFLKSVGNRDSNVHGLSFTYSGGYRMFCSNDPLDSLDDLHGRDVIASLSPLQIDTVGVFGGRGQNADVWHKRNNWFQNRPNLVMQTTWVRYAEWMPEYAPYVLDAQHSLFLTCLIINRDFWRALPEKHQEIFQKCADEAAANEKNLTIQESERYRSGLSKIAKKVVLLSQEEQQLAREMCQPIYDKWERTFIPGLIDKIHAA